MRVRRWTVLGVFVLLLGVLIPSGASAQAPATNGKIGRSLQTVIDRHLGDAIYGDVVAGHVPGNVYYLAKMHSIDAGSLNALRLAGATVRHRFDIIGYVALSSPAAAVAQVAAVPQVERLEMDRVLQLLSATATTATVPGTQFEDQSRRPQVDIGADRAWTSGYTGEGVTVGVVDSGVDSTHGDLADHLDSFVDCSTVLPDFVNDSKGVGTCLPVPGYDDNGHGTHVSGIATGTGAGNPELPGIAPSARLVVAKGCSPAGTCLNSSVMAGIMQVSLPKRLGGAGANVVNLSLGGGPYYAAGIDPAEQETDQDATAQLLDALADQFNVLYSVAAGNAGPTLQSVATPSTSAQAMSVGASVTDFDLDHPTDQTLHGMNGNVDRDAAVKGISAISTFSSRGPSGDRQVKPDVTAPGAYIVSTESLEGGEVHAGDLAVGNNYSADPSYAVLSGTSMAAPSAAGAAALVIDGFHKKTGQLPKYYVTKAALANTAHCGIAPTDTTVCGTYGTAFEGPITGLISSIKSNRLGMDPAELFPPRNDGSVGVSGSGAGRVYVPDAILATTAGVVAYTPAVRDANGVLSLRSLQPSWGLDDVGPGQSATQSFVLHGGPIMERNATVTYRVEQTPEPEGINAASPNWFRLPSRTTVPAGRDASFNATLRLPANAAPGQYAATIVATVNLGGGSTERIRIPVQFFVPVASNTEYTNQIWASDVTDYSIVGLENPEGQIYTDWTLTPYRVPEGVSQLTFKVWDPSADAAGNYSTMDLFAFDSSGVEVNSTVGDDHAIPAGAALVPTTQDAPGTFTIAVYGPNDQGLVKAGDVLWLVGSNTVPSTPAAMDSYTFSVTTTPGQPLTAPDPNSGGIFGL